MTLRHPTVPARPRHARRSVRRSMLALAAALVLLLAACGGDDSGSDDVPPGETDETTSTEGEVEAAESLWVVSTDADSVHQIDLETGEVLSTLTIEGFPTDVVAAFGAVWVADASGGGIIRIDPATAEITDTYEVGDARALAVGDELLWASFIDEPSIAGIDPESGEVVTEVDLSGGEENQWPDSLVVLDDGTIVAEESYAAGLMLIDPDEGVVTSVDLEDVVTDLAVVDDLVYVASFGEVLVVDPATLETEEVLDADARPWALAPVPDSRTMWVASTSGSATTLDIETGAFGEPTELGEGSPQDVLVNGDEVWVVDDAGGLFRLDAASGELLDTYELPDVPGLDAALAIG